MSLTQEQLKPESLALSTDTRRTPFVQAVMPLLISIVGLPTQRTLLFALPMILMVNALFILLLSPASLQTLLLSGDWALTVMIAYFFRDTFKKANSLCAA